MFSRRRAVSAGSDSHDQEHISRPEKGSSDFALHHRRSRADMAHVSGGESRKLREASGGLARNSNEMESLRL
jgi:hypothetical protein